MKNVLKTTSLVLAIATTSLINYKMSNERTDFALGLNRIEVLQTASAEAYHGHYNFLARACICPETLGTCYCFY